MKEKPERGQITYKLIRSKRRTLSLIVTADAELVVRAPLYLSDGKIEEFLTEKEQWITGKLVLAREKRPLTKSYEEGEKLLYLGQEYPLSYVDTGDDIIKLRERFYVNTAARKRIREVLRSWYIFEGYQVISPRVEDMAARLNCKVTDIKITRAEKRWGSCSSKGVICFSWRLIMAPLEVIDYVIIHELVHLKIRDHSPRFWRAVEAILPDYRVKRQWLKDNSHKLWL
jgi:hypothetical protein